MLRPPRFPPVIVCSRTMSLSSAALLNRPAKCVDYVHVVIMSGIRLRCVPLAFDINFVFLYLLCSKFAPFFTRSSMSNIFVVLIIVEAIFPVVPYMLFRVYDRSVVVLLFESD
jgi:hypothetical protein